jgi:hypothetical protein
MDDIDVTTEIGDNQYIIFSDDCGVYGWNIATKVRQIFSLD